MKLQPFLNVHKAKRLPHRRVLNLIDVINLFAPGINNAMFVAEERRQKPTIDITIFVNGCGKHNATIVPVPSWKIRTPPKKRDTKWCACDNHISPFVLIATFLIQNGPLNSTSSI
jgi:hypothetical protein